MKIILLLLFFPAQYCGVKCSFLQEREASIISRPQDQVELKRRGAQTEGAVCGVGTRESGKTDRRDGRRGEEEQLGSVAQNTSAGGGGLRHESRAAVSNSGPAATPNRPSPRTVALQASLALWKYTAEKDRDYLGVEQMYLESLKKKSYKTLSNHGSCRSLLSKVKRKRITAV